MIVTIVKAECDTDDCGVSIRIPANCTQPFTWIIQQGWSIVQKDDVIRILCPKH